MAPASGPAGPRLSGRRAAAPRVHEAGSAALWLAGWRTDGADSASLG